MKREDLIVVLQIVGGFLAVGVFMQGLRVTGIAALFDYVIIAAIYALPVFLLVACLLPLVRWLFGLDPK